MLGVQVGKRGGAWSMHSPALEYALVGVLVKLSA